MIRLLATTDTLFTGSPFPRFSVSLSPSLCRRLTPGICLLLIFFCLATAGCGYHLAGTGGQTPGDIQSVAIAVLDNRTAEIGLETTFTNAIINEFVQWKRLPVKPRNEAEAVLGGSIAQIKTQEVSHFTRDKTATTRVTITLALTLKRVETDEILWKKNLSYFDEYLETGNALDTAILRRDSLRNIARFLAEKIHNDMFEEF